MSTRCDTDCSTQGATTTPPDADDFWLTRVAIIHQLRFKTDTDADRLFGFADRKADEPEFFIRKAIGWALREYVKTDAAAVRAFVDEHLDVLSTLTTREATENFATVTARVRHQR